jgi:hypothetical protein
MVSPSEAMRGITDPLMVSTYVLFVPALVWAAGGFWVESVLLFLSTAWATEYHRLSPWGYVVCRCALCGRLGGAVLRSEPTRTQKRR